MHRANDPKPKTVHPPKTRSGAAADHQARREATIRDERKALRCAASKTRSRGPRILPRPGAGPQCSAGDQVPMPRKTARKMRSMMSIVRLAHGDVRGPDGVGKKNSGFSEGATGQESFSAAEFNRPNPCRPIHGVTMRARSARNHPTSRQPRHEGVQDAHTGNERRETTTY